FEGFQLFGGHFYTMHLEDVPSTVKVGEVLLEYQRSNLNVNLGDVDHVVRVQPHDEFGEFLGFLGGIKDQNTNSCCDAPKTSRINVNEKDQTTKIKDQTTHPLMGDPPLSRVAHELRDVGDDGAAVGSTRNDVVHLDQNTKIKVQTTEIKEQTSNIKLQI
ncbi:hypothetical protein PENTCL1PPCAC_20631, partial [Pristionchus entomophagus]